MITEQTREGEHVRKAIKRGIVRSAKIREPVRVTLRNLSTVVDGDSSVDGAYRHVEEQHKKWKGLNHDNANGSRQRQSILS